MPQPRHDLVRKLFEPLLHGMKLQHQTIDAAVLVTSDTIRYDARRPDEAGTDRLRGNIRARRNIERHGGLFRGLLGLTTQHLRAQPKTKCAAVCSGATAHVRDVGYDLAKI